jgi:hypothetical protein
MIELDKSAQLIKKQLWEIWGKLDSKILEKFKNLNGKTGQYDVPDVLFQKRTSRSNRVLLRWKIIEQNNITIEHLKTFFGGVCVEFVNEDLFTIKNRENELFNYLISKIGSDEKISAMVSFRNEDGDSGATISRENYSYFVSEPRSDYSPIKRKYKKTPGKGDNSVWEGNLFYSIRGGSQESFESHLDLDDPMLFNPAVEYANEKVCLDIDITMSYFALHCFDFPRNEIGNFDDLLRKIEAFLKTSVYYDGNLLDYCKNHYSLSLGNGFLVDPIQLNQMSISDFKTSGLENSSVVCHNEAANKNIFYFDNIQNFILTPARPTNFFWSKHLSNMMQQNYNLDEYFDEEEKRYLKRKGGN